ncbi:unnamed protein product [Urochloa decumbens]|uniref:Ubiquitin-like domain-containing protein n=1 Tax=Urochloa decumbens TaxID=240449 RepID=A0ABC8XVN8_9POAL
MQIVVRNGLTNSLGRSFVLVAKPTDTIFSVMAKIEDITGVPPIQQRMVVNCKSLYDHTPGTLADHKIGEFTTLHAMYCVSGTIRLQEKTLKALGIAVDNAAADSSSDEDVYDEDNADSSSDEDVDDDNDADSSSDDEDVNEEAAGKMRMAVTDYMIPGPARTITLAAEAGDTVASVMEQVQRRRCYPVALQVLTCGRTPLRPGGGATLADYNVTNDSQLELHMNMDFAVALDREERRINMAKEMEIAALVEQQQLADGEK